MALEQRVCKNKNCRKILPEGYKHWYCETCRNKHAQNLKKAGECVLSVAGVALLVVTGGRNLKK